MTDSVPLSSSFEYIEQIYIEKRYIKISFFLFNVILAKPKQSGKKKKPSGDGLSRSEGFLTNAPPAGDHGAATSTLDKLTLGYARRSRNGIVVQSGTQATNIQRLGAVSGSERLFPVLQHNRSVGINYPYPEDIHL